jgi:hypothetical protein
MPKRRTEKKPEQATKPTPQVEYLITNDGTIMLNFGEVSEMIPRTHPQYRVIVNMLKQRSFNSIIRLLNFNITTERLNVSLLRKQNKTWYVGDKKIEGAVAYDIDRLVNNVPDEFIISAVKYEEAKESAEEAQPRQATANAVSAEIAHRGLADFCRKYRAMTVQYVEDEALQCIKTLCVVDLGNVSPSYNGEKITVLFITKSSRQVFACYVEGQVKTIKDFYLEAARSPFNEKLKAVLSQLANSNTEQNAANKKARRISID